MIDENASTNELLTLLKAEQEQAFDFLYARFMRGLCTYGIRQKLSFEDAEEVAHDTLLQVAKQIYTFDEDRGDGSGWIWAIHKNKVVDRLRKNASRHSEKLNDTCLCPDNDSPEQYVENGERWQAITRAWNRLPQWAKQELRLSRGRGRKSHRWYDAAETFRDLIREEEGL
jgi:DNA-directed RNA polymerase specialized sigma24 family protein